MAKEIERKFLLSTTDLRFLAAYPSTPITQGYLHGSGMTSRVRIAGDQAFLTLKGKAQDLERDEWEYPIPLDDAKDMLDKHALGMLVHKMRYRVPVGAHVWEVDVFGGHMDGLVVAEVELSSANEAFVKPSWAGKEVTYEKGFSNKSMALRPRKPLTLVKRAA